MTEQLSGVIPAPGPGVGAGLSACVLLAGALRPPPLVAASGRSVLDFYLAADRSVLGMWLHRFQQLLPAGDGSLLRPPLPVRVVCDLNTPAPAKPRTYPGLALDIEQEPGGYRGPAGVAKDVCAGYFPEATVLVAEAGRYIDCDLRPILAEHLRRGADITVASNADRTPAGVYLIRCRMFGLIPRSGFMDLKEQWLPRAVQSGAVVRAHKLDGGGSFILRTRAQFLRAARAVAARNAPDDGTSAPSEAGKGGGWEAGGAGSFDPGRFRVIAPGAMVASDAVVLDSVVMPGAVVGSGAVVARSLLCEGARVPAGAEVVDAVVGRHGIQFDGAERSEKSWKGAR